MSRRKTILVPIIALLSAWPAFAQANGKLQIHFMDVGQGDGAVLVSPGGEVVLFDTGVKDNCDKPVSYLQQLGIKKIDYLIVSHYHADHIGCVTDVLQEAPLQKDALDRGDAYPSGTFNKYVAAVGSHRKAASPGDGIRLDAGSANPVVITMVALNGAGVSTTNENDLSLVATVAFGSFRAEIGGDLSGENTGNYADIETPVAPNVGRIDLYKVHHHCSSHSTNDNWLVATQPTVGIVSAGDGNSYGHPTADCLERLHKRHVKAYWTERGNGGTPEPGLDVVGGNIIVEVEPGASTFSVTHSGNRVDTFAVGGGPPPPPGLPAFSWSKKSSKYHVTNCAFVANISPANLQQGNSPPDGKTLHDGCPK